jgi:ribokinase
MNKILVIGSSNTDLVARIKKFPTTGETVEGISFLQAMGGKGANQALAAHRLGGDVKFITCLGNDANGLNSLKYYEQEGLDVSSSLIVDNVPSGTAMIWVEESGENCIVITPGANKMLTSEYIYKVEEAIAEADIVLLQMEIPYETVRTVCNIAQKHQTKIMLNVAPARQLDEVLLKQVDILVVNETEAELVSGEKIEDVGKETVVDMLLDTGVKSVVLTLGKQGCFFKNHQKFHYVPAFHVEPLDTTAAGDTFCGALAAELGRGHKWNEVLRFATAASAICVTRMGAQPSIPTEKEVFEFLSKNPVHQEK